MQIVPRLGWSQKKVVPPGNCSSKKVKTPVKGNTKRTRKNGNGPGIKHSQVQEEKVLDTKARAVLYTYRNKEMIIGALHPSGHYIKRKRVWRYGYRENQKYMMRD